MRNVVAAMAFALLVAACATGGDSRGWTGDRAAPFDGAKEACESSSASLPKGDRRAAFDACMAKAGWHRR